MRSRRPAHANSFGGRGSSVSVGGGAGRFVTTGEEAPKFSADGTRIYYTTNVPGFEKMTRKLQSVTLDGLDVREHARTLDADTIELRISPERLTDEIAGFLDECWRPRRRGGSSRKRAA